MLDPELDTVAPGHNSPTLSGEKAAIAPAKRSADAGLNTAAESETLEPSNEDRATQTGQISSVLCSLGRSDLPAVAASPRDVTESVTGTMPDRLASSGVSKQKHTEIAPSPASPPATFPENGTETMSSGNVAPKASEDKVAEAARHSVSLLQNVSLASVADISAEKTAIGENVSPETLVDISSLEKVSPAASLQTRLLEERDSDGYTASESSSESGLDGTSSKAKNPHGYKARDSPPQSGSESNMLEYTTCESSLGSGSENSKSDEKMLTQNTRQQDKVIADTSPVVSTHHKMEEQNESTITVPEHAASPVIDHSVDSPVEPGTMDSTQGKSLLHGKSAERSGLSGKIADFDYKQFSPTKTMADFQSHNAETQQSTRGHIRLCVGGPHAFSKIKISSQADAGTGMYVHRCQIKQTRSVDVEDSDPEAMDEAEQTASARKALHTEGKGNVEGGDPDVERSPTKWIDLSKQDVDTLHSELKTLLDGVHHHQKRLDNRITDTTRSLADRQMKLQTLCKLQIQKKQPVDLTNANTPVVAQMLGLTDTDVFATEDDLKTSLIQLGDVEDKLDECLHVIRSCVKLGQVLKQGWQVAAPVSPDGSVGNDTGDQCQEPQLCWSQLEKNCNPARLDPSPRRSNGRGFIKHGSYGRKETGTVCRGKETNIQQFCRNQHYCVSKRFQIEHCRSHLSSSTMHQTDRSITDLKEQKDDEIHASGPKCNVDVKSRLSEDESKSKDRYDYKRYSTRWIHLSERRVKQLHPELQRLISVCIRHKRLVSNLEQSRYAVTDTHMKLQTLCQLQILKTQPHILSDNEDDHAVVNILGLTDGKILAIDDDLNNSVLKLSDRELEECLHVVHSCIDVDHWLKQGWLATDSVQPDSGEENDTKNQRQESEAAAAAAAAGPAAHPHCSQTEQEKHCNSTDLDPSPRTSGDREFPKRDSHGCEQAEIVCRVNETEIRRFKRFAAIVLSLTQNEFMSIARSKKLPTPPKREKKNSPKKHCENTIVLTDISRAEILKAPRQLLQPAQVEHTAEEPCATSPESLVLEDDHHKFTGQSLVPAPEQLKAELLPPCMATYLGQDETKRQYFNQLYNQSAKPSGHAKQSCPENLTETFLDDLKQSLMENQLEPQPPQEKQGRSEIGEEKQLQEKMKFVEDIAPPKREVLPLSEISGTVILPKKRPVGSDSGGKRDTQQLMVPSGQSPMKKCCVSYTSDPNNDSPEGRVKILSETESVEKGKRVLTTTRNLETGADQNCVTKRSHPDQKVGNATHPDGSLTVKKACFIEKNPEIHKQRSGQTEQTVTSALQPKHSKSGAQFKSPMQEIEDLNREWNMRHARMTEYVSYPIPLRNKKLSLNYPIKEMEDMKSDGNMKQHGSHVKTTGYISYPMPLKYQNTLGTFQSEIFNPYGKISLGDKHDYGTSPMADDFTEDIDKDTGETNVSRKSQQLPEVHGDDTSVRPLRGASSDRTAGEDTSELQHCQSQGEASPQGSSSDSPDGPGVRLPARTSSGLNEDTHQKSQQVQARLGEHSPAYVNLDDPDSCVIQLHMHRFGSSSNLNQTGKDLGDKQHDNDSTKPSEAEQLSDADKCKENAAECSDKNKGDTSLEHSALQKLGDMVHDLSLKHQKTITDDTFQPQKPAITEENNNATLPQIPTAHTETGVNPGVKGHEYEKSQSAEADTSEIGRVENSLQKTKDQTRHDGISNSFNRHHQKSDETATVSTFAYHTQSTDSSSSSEEDSPFGNRKEIRKQYKQLERMREERIKCKENRCTCYSRNDPDQDPPDVSPKDNPPKPPEKELTIEDFDKFFNYRTEKTEIVDEYAHEKRTRRDYYNFLFESGLAQYDPELASLYKKLPDPMAIILKDALVQSKVDEIGKRPTVPYPSRAMRRAILAGSVSPTEQAVVAPDTAKDETTHTHDKDAVKATTWQPPKPKDNKLLAKCTVEAISKARLKPVFNAGPEAGGPLSRPTTPFVPIAPHGPLEEGVEQSAEVRPQPVIDAGTQDGGAHGKPTTPFVPIAPHGRQEGGVEQTARDRSAGVGDKSDVSSSSDSSDSSECDSSPKDGRLQTLLERFAGVRFSKKIKMTIWQYESLFMNWRRIRKKPEQVVTLADEIGMPQDTVKLWYMRKMERKMRRKIPPKPRHRPSILKRNTNKRSKDDTDTDTAERPSEEPSAPDNADDRFISVMTARSPLSVQTMEPPSGTLLPQTLQDKSSRYASVHPHAPPPSSSSNMHEEGAQASQSQLMPTDVQDVTKPTEGESKPSTSGSEASETPLSAQDIQYLETMKEVTPYPTETDFQSFAEDVEAPVQVVKEWFYTELKSATQTMRLPVKHWPPPIPAFSPPPSHTSVQVQSVQPAQTKPTTTNVQVCPVNPARDSKVTSSSSSSVDPMPSVPSGSVKAGTRRLTEHDINYLQNMKQYIPWPTEEDLLSYAKDLEVPVEVVRDIMYPPTTLNQQLKKNAPEHSSPSGVQEEKEGERGIGGQAKATAQTNEGEDEQKPRCLESWLNNAVMRKRTKRMKHLVERMKELKAAEENLEFLSLAQLREISKIDLELWQYFQDIQAEEEKAAVEPPPPTTPVTATAAVAAAATTAAAAKLREERDTAEAIWRSIEEF